MRPITVVLSANFTIDLFVWVGVLNGCRECTVGNSDNLFNREWMECGRLKSISFVRDDCVE